nr:MAG TPA: hypothetical protein [Caudoviricetes sp.]
MCYSRYSCKKSIVFCFQSWWGTCLSIQKLLSLLDARTNTC